MSDRVHIPGLRKMSPVALEIHTADVFRRPLDQVDVRTMVDLCALADAEGVPLTVARNCQGFAEKMHSEIGDLPAGGPFVRFVGELEGLDAKRIPNSVREAVAAAADAEGRPEIEREAAARLIGTWEDSEPETFAILVGGHDVHVKKMESESTDSGDSSPRRKPMRRRAAPAHDEERVRFIVEAVIERLERRDDGLLEAVLVAGVTRAAQRAGHTRMGPHEVRSVLKDLKAQERVRHSAGRWSRVRF